MNLSDLLNYRQTCLIHHLPMETMKTTYHIRDPQDPSEHYLRRCVECGKNKRVDELFKETDRERFGITNINNVKDQIHLYTFHVDPVMKLSLLDDSTLQITADKEVIKCHRDNKFYHMSATLGGGEAIFKMGNCASETLVQQLLDSLMSLKIPYFDPARIQSIDQLIEKIKLYTLFS